MALANTKISPFLCTILCSLWKGCAQLLKDGRAEKLGFQKPQGPVYLAFSQPTKHKPFIAFIWLTAPCVPLQEPAPTPKIQLSLSSPERTRALWGAVGAKARVLSCCGVFAWHLPTLWLQPLLSAFQFHKHRILLLKIAAREPCRATANRTSSDGFDRYLHLRGFRSYKVDFGIKHTLGFGRCLWKETATCQEERMLNLGHVASCMTVLCS